MKYLPYILKHLRRNWIRTASTIIAMALCIFLICVLQTPLTAFYGGLETREHGAPDHAAPCEPGVQPAASPMSRGIEAMPGVKRVAKVELVRRHGRAAGGQPDMKNFFPNFAVDAEPYLAMYPEYRLTPERNRRSWRTCGARSSARSSRQKFGWKIGSTFQLESIIPPYRVGRPFEFVVRAIYDVDRQRYPNRRWTSCSSTGSTSTRRPGSASASAPTTCRSSNPTQAAAVAKAIDAHVREQRRRDEDRDRGAVPGELPRAGRRSRAHPERDRPGGRVHDPAGHRQHDEHGHPRAADGDRGAEDARLLERAGAGAGARRGARHRHRRRRARHR